MYEKVNSVNKKIFSIHVILLLIVFMKLLTALLSRNNSHSASNNTLFHVLLSLVVNDKNKISKYKANRII